MPSIETSPALPAFDSDAAYWTFELTRLDEHLSALQVARSDPSFLPRFVELTAARMAQRSAIRAARTRAVASGTAIAWHALVERFDLDAHEEMALLIAVAAALDSTIARHVMALQREQRTSHPALPTVALVETLFDATPHRPLHASWLDAGRPLRQRRLIELTGDGPMTLQALRVPDFVVHAAQGNSDALDERLRGVASLQRSRERLVDVIVPEPLWREVNQIGQGLSQRSCAGPWVVAVCGPRHSGKTRLVTALAGELGRSCLTVSAGSLVARHDAAELLSLAVHNAAFADAVLHLEGCARLFEQRPDIAELVVRLIQRYDGLVVLEIEDGRAVPRSLSGCVGPVLELPAATFESRVSLWERALNSDVELDGSVGVEELAQQFDLTGAQMDVAVRWAQLYGPTRGGSAVSMEGLRTAAEQQLRSDLGDLLTMGRAELTLTDLVLPEEARAAVQELVDACRVHRDVLRGWGLGRRLVTGRGIVALFSGGPGTGKSLCAEVLANELGLELHTVNVPSVTSRWVGETEKNLSRIFGEARADGAVLLFDEADSLFGKRVKVERAQDHYQNLAVNQLLREIERYEGIVVLTTNLEANFDSAFERRILYRIDFPEPDEAARRAIWRTLVPPQMPLADDVDFELLAHEYELTGALIKNALVAAAYACRAAGTALTHDALERAAQRQARSVGKLTRSPRPTPVIVEPEPEEDRWSGALLPYDEDLDIRPYRVASRRGY